MAEDSSLQVFRKNFSQRNGFASVPPPLNPGEIPQQLRLEFDDLLKDEQEEGDWTLKTGGKAADWYKILSAVWVEKFGRQRCSATQQLCLEMCSRVIRNGNFDEVFSLMEDLAIRVGDNQPTFQKRINESLMRQQAPYVLYKSPENGWMIIQTGTEIERNTVIQCLSDLKDPAFEKTRGHLERAGQHLTKGEFSGTAGQSAKALEACLRKLVGKPNATGGQALNLYEEKFRIPGPLKTTIKGIWDYRNDADDVGHSEKDDATCPIPNKWDAQFVYTVVASSISYLINRVREEERG